MGHTVYQHFTHKEEDIMTSLFILGCLVAMSKALDIGLSTKCVPIPQEMGMCNDISYTEMRLPNLLGHTSMAELVPKSNEWLHLLQTGCHPYARNFLCSLFAPVCLDTFVQPCRSMCVAVRESCAPVLACHGHSWPESLNCDRFPADGDICLDSVTKEYQFIYKEMPKPTCQGCPLIEEFFSQKTVLEAFCDNNFAVKVKLSKRKSSSTLHDYTIEGQIEFIKQGLLLPYDTRNMIEQWLLINQSCAQRLIRNGRSMVYIIAGDIHHGKVVVNRVFYWQKKDFQLTLATRKWRHHKC